MSILDDAIREHLELKRAHGADDAELKRLEDEAFGPPERPGQSDSFAEAPTEFLVAPETGAEEQADEEGGRRAPNIADLQEAPQPAETEDAPAEEEQPAMEHETIAEPGPSTEERHAIASQPTEIFDVEGQFEEAPAEAAAPADEELVEAEQGEPRLTPAAEEEPADEFDEFFSEQRLSDELNQALEAPLPDEPGLVPAEDAAGFAEPAEEPLAEPGALEEQVELGREDRRTERDSTSEFILPESREESEPAEHAAPPIEPAPPAEEPAPPATSSSSHEDVLEDTPEFLEESPEDDELWFEQKPPKDIDFGD